MDDCKIWGKRVELARAQLERICKSASKGESSTWHWARLEAPEGQTLLDMESVAQCIDDYRMMVADTADGFFGDDDKDTLEALSKRLETAHELIYNFTTPLMSMHAAKQKLEAASRKKARVK